MKKVFLLAMLFFFAFLSAPVFAQAGPPFQDPPMGPQGIKPGCRMLGGSGMGMGHGMRGRMGHGMRNCMTGGCWQDGMMGRMGGMANCPGPRNIIRAAFREIAGYLTNADALGLNAEQVQRLQGIEDDFASAAIKGKADLQIAAIDFRRAMARDLPDVQKAEKVITSSTGTWQSLQKKAVNSIVEARKVLTPEQRQKAEKMTCMGCAMMPYSDEGEQPADGDEMEH